MSPAIVATRNLQPHERWREAAGSASGAEAATDFCKTCALYHACAMVGFGKPELSPLHGLMEHLGPYRPDEVIFRQGDPFEAVFAVRAGTVKTRQIDAEGREHVLGFHLPGEVIGLTAIHPGRFPCDAVALENTFPCRFSFPAMSTLAAHQPAVQQHLFRLISKELGAASLLAGDHPADVRMAAFLVNLGERYAARGASGTEFRLSMSRGDIANYLRLAAETVSRVLSRFSSQKLIVLKGRDLHLINLMRLRELGHGLLGS